MTFNFRIFFEKYSVFLIIFSSLLFVYLGTVTNIFLYHDDYVSQYWYKEGGINIFKKDIYSHPYSLWNNALGRPLGASFTALSNYFVTTVNDGGLIRFFSILLLSIFSFSTYRLLIKNSYTKYFSIFFAISISTLPVLWIAIYQVTGMYIVITLLYALISMHFCDSYIKEKPLFSCSKYKYLYIFFIIISFWLYKTGSQGDGGLGKSLQISTVIMFSALYVFLLIWNKKLCNYKVDTNKAIIIILTLFLSYNIYASAAGFSLFYLILFIFSNDNYLDEEKISKFMKLAILLTVPMFFYFLSVKYFNGLDSTQVGRQIKIDFNLMPKIEHYFKIILPMIFNGWSSDWGSTNWSKYSSRQFLAYSSSFIAFLFIILNLLKNKVSVKYILIVLAAIIFCLGLTIASSLFVKGNYFVPARLLIGHTAIIYFILMWVIWKATTKISSYDIFNINVRVFVSIISLISICFYSQHVISKNIIYPLSEEFAYISKSISNSKAFDKIKNNENITILAINFTDDDYSVENNIASTTLAISSTRHPYIDRVANSIINEKFYNVDYSLNYKTYYSLVKTIVEKEIKYVHKDSWMQWGKVIDTHGAILDNDLRLDPNIMSKAIIRETTGSKKVASDFKSSNYTLTIDMRKFRENFNKEFDELNDKAYYTRINKYLKLY